MVSRRVFVQASAFGVGAIALGAAALPQRGAAQDQTTFVMGSLEEPGSLSALVQLPHHFPADVPQTLLFDSLTQFMPDATVAPKLATEWQVSEDELTYTFTLNPDAKFHDGTPVTAHDVVFTFEAMLDPATNSSTEGVENVASIEATDDHTVVIQLSAITPSFLAQGGGRGIVPKHVLEGKDIATDEFNRMPVGSGPYKIVSFMPGESIIMEAVPDHYRGAPTIQRVEYKTITDQNVMLTQLMSGELSYALATPRDMAALAQSENVEIVEVPTPRFFNFIPNFERSYWQDADVRAAILGAIDREGIVASILMGHGEVINANTTSASWAFTEEGIAQHPYDPEASAAALDEAGWVVGDNGIRAKDGEDFAFSVMLYSYDVTLQQAMLVAQQNLEAIGVSMEIETVESGVFGARRNEGDFDALARIWNPVYDPDQSGLLRTGNFSGYSNPELDALLDESIATSDMDARREVYAEIQQFISTDLPALYLYSENELHATSVPVDGMASHPVNVFWNFSSWSLG